MLNLNVSFLSLPTSQERAVHFLNSENACQQCNQSDVTWLSSAEVNEACWITAAEALQTEQMKCYTQTHSAQRHCSPIQKGNKHLQGLSADICDYLLETLPCRTSLSSLFIFSDFCVPTQMLDRKKAILNKAPHQTVRQVKGSATFALLATGLYSYTA